MQEGYQLHRPSRLSIDEAVNRIGMGPFQHKVLCATGTCFMADSMEVMLLSFLTRILKVEWNNDNDDEEKNFFEKLHITSCMFAGAMVGTLILGPLGDKVGRKPVMFTSAALISVFGLLTAFSTGYTMLIPILFMVGFGVGGATVPFDILAEFLPTHERGTYLLLIKYFWTFGCMIVPLVGYVSLEIFDSWRLFAGICSAPCILSCLIGWIYVPESPRWLLSEGRTEEALGVLRRAAIQNGVDPKIAFPEGCNLVDEVEEWNRREDEMNGGKEKGSKFGELLSPKLRNLTILLWMIWGGYAFSYYGTIMTTTRIFDEEDDDNDNMEFDYMAIFISSIAELVGTSLAILKVDDIGRNLTMILSFANGGVALFFLCTLAAVLDNDKSRIALTSLAFISRALVMTGACVTWITTAELLSTELRSTGHSAANAMARLGAFFAPFLVEADTSLFHVGIVLACVSCFTAFCVTQLPETKGLELGQASSLVSPSSTMMTI